MKPAAQGVSCNPDCGVELRHLLYLHTIAVVGSLMACPEHPTASVSWQWCTPSVWPAFWCAVPTNTRFPPGSLQTDRARALWKCSWPLQTQLRRGIATRRAVCPLAKSAQLCLGKADWPYPHNPPCSVAPLAMHMGGRGARSPLRTHGCLVHFFRMAWSTFGPISNVSVCFLYCPEAATVVVKGEVRAVGDQSQT